MVKIEPPRNCELGLSEWMIRFKITEANYLNLITICRDDSERRTQYSFTDMRPDAKFVFQGAPSPQFRFGSYHFLSLSLFIILFIKG